MMAERVGFEPTVAKGYTRSPGVPDRPLQHLSAFKRILYILSLSQFTPPAWRWAIFCMEYEITHGDIYEPGVSIPVMAIKAIAIKVPEAAEITENNRPCLQLVSVTQT